VQVLHERRVVLIEAPGGYGKTTLAMQAAAALDLTTVRVLPEPPVAIHEVLARALRRAGIPELAAAATTPPALAAALAARPTGIMLVIDEVQRAGEADAEWLVELADLVEPPSRLVLVGRRLGRTIASYGHTNGIEIVGADQLRFDVAETTAVMDAVAGEVSVDPDEVQAVLAVTQGWPAAVALAAARWARGQGLPTGTGQAVLAGLVHGLLAPLGPDTEAAVCALAELPLLSAEVAEAVAGRGTFDTVLDIGLPVQFRPDGWGELADPVRDLLRPRSTLEPAARRAVATIYARHGEAATACLLLAQAHDQDGLATFLAEMTWQQLADLGPSTLAIVLAALDDAVVAKVPIVLARAALAADELDPGHRAAWLERGQALVETGPARRAIDAEIARDLQRQHRLDASEAILRRVVAEAASDELLTLGRAHLALALGQLVREQGHASSESMAMMEQAAGFFRLAGERRFEAITLRSAAYGIHYTSGALDVASEQLGRAVALLSAPDAARALCLTFVADVERDLGRFDRAEVAVNEALGLSRRLGSRQAVGYAAWGAALLAGERRDAETLEHWAAEAIRNGDPWIARGAGIDFYGQMAECRMLVGDREGAAAFLAECEERAAVTGYEWPAVAARARFEAVHGDARRAIEVLDHLDTIGPPRDRPVQLLERAVAVHRLGDDARRDELVTAAHAACAALGDPDRLARREPELLELCGRPADAPEATVMVRLLGPFAVRRGGLDVTPPSGLPSKLVKMLAVRGRLTIDQAIDEFWPDADLATGRSRLRNLLNRLHSATGPLIERREDLLVLTDGVEVDLVRFEEAAATTFAAPPAERGGLARVALARFTGELLPGDRYEDWTLASREWSRQRHVALLDLLADDALDRGDLDDAVQMLSLAIEAEPLDSARYVRAAEILTRQGRAHGAAQLAAQAIGLQEELGLVPDPALLAFTEG
jgi:DNA-binding SARP family transcriptional activator